MARILLGPDVIDKRGRQANQVYSSWKSGMAYTRNIATVIRNPNSARQAAKRDLVGTLSRQWQTLGKTSQAKWNLIAAVNYRGGQGMGGAGGVKDLIKGSADKITGINAFVQNNQLAQDVGATAIITDPLPHTPAPNAPVIAVADGIGKITVTWDDILNVTPSQYVRVFIATHQKRFHKQLIGYASGAAKTLDITEVRGQNGEMVPIDFFNGDEVIVQADAVDQATGWASPPSKTVQHVITLVPAP